MFEVALPHLSLRRRLLTACCDLLEGTRLTGAEKRRPPVSKVDDLIGQQICAHAYKSL